MSAFLVHSFLVSHDELSFFNTGLPGLSWASPSQKLLESQGTGRLGTTSFGGSPLLAPGCPLSDLLKSYPPPPTNPWKTKKPLNTNSLGGLNKNKTKKHLKHNKQTPVFRTPPCLLILLLETQVLAWIEAPASPCSKCPLWSGCEVKPLRKKQVFTGENQAVQTVSSSTIGLSNKACLSS